MWGVPQVFCFDAQLSDRSTPSPISESGSGGDTLVNTALSTVASITGGGWAPIRVGTGPVFGDVVAGLGDVLVTAQNKEYSISKGEELVARVVCRKQCRFFVSPKGGIFYAEPGYRRQTLYALEDDGSSSKLCVARDAVSVYMCKNVFVWPTSSRIIVYDPEQKCTHVSRPREKPLFCARNGELVSYSPRTRRIKLAPSFANVCTAPKKADRILAFDAECSIWVYGTPDGDIIAHQGGTRAFSMRERFGVRDIRGRAVLFGNDKKHILLVQFFFQFKDRVEAIDFETQRLITSEIPQIDSLTSDLVLINSEPYILAHH